MSYYHENYHHTLFNTYQDWYDNYVTNLNKEPSPTEKYMAKIFFDKWYHIQGGTKMSKSAWVVTENGYTFGYGAEIYLIGVFSTEEAAEACKEPILNKFDGAPHPIKITKIDMDTPFNLKSTDSRVYWENDYYLGGYVE